MNEQLTSVIQSEISKNSEFFNSVSQEIWKHPELKHEEKYAHDLLTKVLIKKGFSVQRNYIIPTAFRAEFSQNVPGPAIAVICEYDALPEVGHACGHNLIAEAGIAAGIGIKAAFEFNPSLSGKVVVLGTPAEEGGGGKIELIKGGAFKDIDVALMVHPSPHDHLYPPFIAVSRVTVTYTGKEAHACGYPWEGLNALDAAVACYNNIALLRQHIKPTCKIHGVITNGGVVPNVIPALSEIDFQFRAATSSDLEILRKRMESCFIGAANATGCEVNFEYDNSTQYDSLITNRVLAELYKKHAEKMGVIFQDGNPKIIPFMASSDMGNVSHVVPSIHPTYSIGSKAVNHSKAFTEAAGSFEAQKYTLIAAQSIALLSVELLTDCQLFEKVKKQFHIDILEDEM